MSARDLKLGRRPPINKPALRLADFLTGTIPAHPASEDYLGALGGGWAMLGNDQYGDCVAVTWANVRRLVTASLTGRTVYPDLAAVEALYKTQNPNFPADDNGMDIQTCLEYLVKTGGPDSYKAVAFAKVDVGNLEEVKAALAIFGYVWTGLTVLDANMDDFDAGRPWDVHPGSPVDGGHSVIAGGYSGQAADDIKFVTWAQETGFTDAFWRAEVEEGWVVIWPEHLGTAAFLEGINTAALAAAFQAITGKVLVIPPGPAPIPVPPAPVPVPPPAPPAPPAPTPPLPPEWERFLHRVEAFIREGLHDLFGGGK